ncbi:MAG: hypothetical protein HKN29_10420 [Rhodothermales bacterium]|nr:hypothetical protein [Rhodothermales bacterium]
MASNPLRPVPRLTDRIDVALDPVLSLGILYDLEEHPGSTLCVDRDLTIRYLNPAWYQFMDVTGQVTDFDMGTGLCDGYREREKTYFTAALNRVFKERRSLNLEYECACRDAYRLFELNLLWAKTSL